MGIWQMDRGARCCAHLPLHLLTNGEVPRATVHVGTWACSKRPTWGLGPASEGIFPSHQGASWAGPSCPAWPHTRHGTGTRDSIGPALLKPRWTPARCAGETPPSASPLETGAASGQSLGFAMPPEGQFVDFSTVLPRALATSVRELSRTLSAKWAWSTQPRAVVPQPSRMVRTSC